MSPLRIITLLFLSSAAAFLSGCHNNEDDEPTGPQAILTLQVDQNYRLQGDTWIFASDQDGEILDVQPYINGQTVTLMSDKHPDKINVTTFSYMFYEGENTQFSFNTWGDVATGTTINFKVEEAHLIDYVRSKATFRISNYTNTLELWNIANGYAYNFNSSLGDGNLEIDLSFYDAPSDILLYSWRSGVPVYYWANGVKTGDVIERDFSTDFMPYPHQLKLDFPGRNTAVILGYDAKKSRNVIMMNTFGFSHPDHPTIGYLDGFDSYDMTVTNEQENGWSTSYRQKGAIDFSFDMPSYTFTLGNNDIQNFSFNFSRNYAYYSAVWQHIVTKEYTWWTVNAPPGYAVKGLSIPPEIIAKYPQLDMDKLVYSSLSLTEVIKGRSYQEFAQSGLDAYLDKTSEVYVYRVK